MKNEKVCIVVACAVFFAITGKSDAADLAVTTSLEKLQFQSGESIIVTTTLQNLSTNSITTRAPRATSAAVRIRLERQIEDNWLEMSPPPHRKEAELIELQAGQSSSQSCELLIRARNTKLEPGIYRIWSSYHPHEYRLMMSGAFSAQYLEDVIQSEKVQFTVIETSESELAAEDELDEIRVEENESARAQLYKDFLQTHTSSIWRFHAFDALGDAVFRTESKFANVDFLRRFQNEHISTCLRDLLKVEEAEILKDLGRTQEALQAIQGVKSLDAEHLRWLIQEGL